MKITEISIARLAVPLKHPYQLSREYGVFATATPVLATIRTDEGLTGCGECDPWPLFTGDSSEISALILKEHFAPALIGRDPCNINEMHRIMDATIRYQHLTKSAIDMAAHDLFGKSVGLPVHQLLGGKRRDTMKTMWSVGGNSPETLAQAVLDAKNSGYYGCMIKVGSDDYKNDAACTAAAREAAGSDFPMIADANQGWDADTAIRYGKLIRHCDLLFLEQPVQSWDVDGLAKIRRAIDIPVSADEGVVTLQDARSLVKAEAADIFSIKVTKHGGIRPAKEICEFAAANGIQVFFNSMIEEGVTQAASLALAAVCPNIVTTIGHAFFSPQRLKTDICSFYRQIKRGYVEISDRPGLGIELDPDAIREYTVENFTIS